MRALLLSLSSVLACAQAQAPSAIIDAYADVQREARAAQAAIDAEHTKNEQRRYERQLIEAQGTSFALRNQELEAELATVQRHLHELDEDIEAVAETQTGIVTLLTAMTDALARFVELDLPFRTAQRREAVGALRQALTGSEATIAGKYQAVVSAYLREIEYGSANEVFGASIVTSRGEHTVTLLKIGRAGLWYVTPDGQSAGRWDRLRRRWVDDGRTDPDQVLRAIRMLRDDGPVTAIDLPVDLAVE